MYAGLNIRKQSDIPSDKRYSKLTSHRYGIRASLPQSCSGFFLPLAVGALVVGDAVGDVGAAVGEVVGEVGAAVGVVVGDVGAEVSGYANEYKSLLGDPAPKPVRAFFVVKFRISVLTSDGDAPGYDWRYSAITPRTYGAAIDVPGKHEDQRQHTINHTGVHKAQ